ncbi:hypothetical protein IAD21_00920 [Abditibacteriota bacterium]|nr:hypothetical protein IAD21_00920 [Abditibacteriota bacterium]
MNYIANCISRILNAPAHISQHWKRECDIALAVSIAATEGEQEAHAYLVRLCVDAEEGCYSQVRELAPHERF